MHKRLLSAVNSANNPMLGDLVAQPLSNPYKMPTDQYESLGHAVVPMMNVRSKQREDFARPQEMLANATNFGARYVVPGAGIALAAKGIGDVAFGGPSDQQEPNQLDYGERCRIDCSWCRCSSSSRTCKQVPW